MVLTAVIDAFLRRAAWSACLLLLSAAALSACASSPALSQALPTSAAAPAPTPTYDPWRPTDPKTVVLAGGKPQLIEFFAYW